MHRPTKFQLEVAMQEVLAAGGFWIGSASPPPPFGPLTAIIAVRGGVPVWGTGILQTTIFVSPRHGNFGCWIPQKLTHCHHCHIAGDKQAERRRRPTSFAQPLPPAVPAMRGTLTSITHDGSCRPRISNAVGGVEMPNRPQKLPTRPHGEKLFSPLERGGGRQ